MNNIPGATFGLGGVEPALDFKFLRAANGSIPPNIETPPTGFRGFGASSTSLSCGSSCVLGCLSLELKRSSSSSSGGTADFCSSGFFISCFFAGTGEDEPNKSSSLSSPPNNEFVFFLVDDGGVAVVVGGAGFGDSFLLTAIGLSVPKRSSSSSSSSGLPNNEDEGTFYENRNEHTLI